MRDEGAIIIINFFRDDDDGKLILNYFSGE